MEGWVCFTLGTYFLFPFSGARLIVGLWDLSFGVGSGFRFGFGCLSR